MPAPARPLVLLDRDGVINRDSDQYIRSVADWQPLPGSLDAIARLTRAGFPIAVVTNQSGVGRGYFSEATLADIHAAMQAAVLAAGGRIDGIYHCPHRPDENCACRKPKPLLLERALAAHGGGVSGACYIGDKLSDVEAARAAAIRPILVGPLAAAGSTAGVDGFANLAAAVDGLLAETGC